MCNQFAFHHQFINSGLIRGVQNLSRERQTVFFQIPGPSTTLGVGESLPSAPEARLTSQACDHRHKLQEHGGLVETWFLYDGDILCHPVLVAPYLKAFDGVNVRVRSQRSRLEQDVIYYAASQATWAQADGSMKCSLSEQ